MGRWRDTSGVKREEEDGVGIKSIGNDDKFTNTLKRHQQNARGIPFTSHSLAGDKIMGLPQNSDLWEVPHDEVTFQIIIKMKISP